VAHSSIEDKYSMRRGSLAKQIFQPHYQSTHCGEKVLIQWMLCTNKNNAKQIFQHRIFKC